MAQHIEINPDPESLPLSLADRAMAMARGMQTSNTGTIRVPTGNGNDLVIGKGSQDGANWIDPEGVQHPLVDTSAIDKAAQDAQKAADAATAKADQLRTDVEAEMAGVRKDADDAAKKADDAATKAERVRTDTASAVQSVKDQAASADSKAQAASDKADKLAGSITDVTATVNGHSTRLKELSTKVEGAVSANGETVRSVTELRQTVTGMQTTVSQNSKTASDALSKATSVEQTASGLTATLSRDYQTTKAADARYSSKTELSATSQSLGARITEAAKKGDTALSKAASVEATASGLTATIGEQSKRLDSTVSTLNAVKATADSNSATIRQVSGSFLMDPCFATGADKVYNISVNADDPLGVDLPGTATSYGKSVGGYDDKASNVTVTTIPGHTYRMEFDWKPASDMPADVDEGIGAFVRKPDGSAYSDFVIAGVGSNRDVRWHHVVKDWTAPSDGSWPKVVPAIRTHPRARYLLTNWRFYDYTANWEILSKATSVEQSLNGFKTSVSQTYETKSDSNAKKATLEQNLNGFKSEVGRTYATKSDMGKQSSGSNLWCNQLFDPDKPQITRLVDNVTASNGSRVNLLASRDNFNPGTSFPVVPGRTYVITAYCKNIKGGKPLNAGIWYTQLTSGHAFDGFVGAESAAPLGDGWMSATWRFACPAGKSRGCVYFQIDQWNDNPSTQWLVANVTCADVTGLQPAGDYATNSSLSQTADSIRASVAENARKADAAMSKASSVEQTASGLSTRISEVARKGDQTVQSLNTLSADVTGFKQTVQQTYATGSRVGRLESGLDGFKSTVSQTYSPKSEVTDLANSTVRSYKFTPLYNKASWVKLGFWKSGGGSGVASVRVYSGDGYNSAQDQNGEFTIMVKDGSTWDTNHDRDFGVNLIRIRNASGVRAKVISYHPDGQHDQCDIWAYIPYAYGHGSYDVSFTGSWQNMNQAQEGEPGGNSSHTVQASVGEETLSNTSYVDQTSRSVSLGVVEEYKNGQHGSALATQSDITVAKNSITSSVSSTYATKTGVTQEISSKITQNNNSLDVRFATKTETQSARDTANTANSHASDAQSRVGSLESCIRMTSAGVRVGRIVNGSFQGYSALLNSAGSFDVLDSNSSPVARFDAKGLTMTDGRLWLNDVPQHRDPALDWEGGGNGGFSIKLTHFGGRMFLIRASATVRRAHVGAADYEITDALPYSFLYTRIAGYLHVGGLPVGTAFGLVDGRTLYISTEDYGNEVSQEISGVAIVRGL